jgi:acetyl esterase/lipase
MLSDESTRLAPNAKAAGVDVTLEECPDKIHVWQLISDRLEDGRRAIAGVGAFLRRHIS